MTSGCRSICVFFNLCHKRSRRDSLRHEIRLISSLQQERKRGLSQVCCALNPFLVASNLSSVRRDILVRMKESSCILPDDDGKALILSNWFQQNGIFAYLFSSSRIFIFSSSSFLSFSSQFIECRRIFPIFLTSTIVNCQLFHFYILDFI